MTADGRLPRLSWRRLSLRWRLMLIGTAGLTVGLAVGGLLLLAALVVASDRSVDAGANQTASDVVDLINADQLSQPLPVAGIQLVQVVDSQNRVLAGSPGADRLVSLLDSHELGLALSGKRLEIDGGRAFVDGPLRVLARSAGPVGHRSTVIVAVPLTDTQGELQSLRIALLTLFLPLVLGLAAIAWWVIGRTLRPVEALRAGAEEITGQVDGENRLPVPAGADEIHRLAVTLNDMLDRLREGRRTQRQFVADAAHELRNPLAGMRTHLEVAQRHPDRVDLRELTDDLLTDTERLTALADGLLLLAETDEASTSARRSTSAVPVAEALATVIARYKAARVAVCGADLEELAPVQVNPEDLYRVLTNLVDNAVRHARSQVWLGAQPAATGDIQITVTDDGPGIAAADRDVVFRRFTRLDHARTSDGGGAGLGLAIVAELVRRNGGAVRLDDAAPGLRVEILLPSSPG